VDYNLLVVNNPSGAFGHSLQSLAWFLLYFADQGEIGQSKSLIFEPINLTGKNNMGLTFNYAYTGKNYNAHDTFRVLVSNDCGASWQVVWQKWGSNLATAATDWYCPKKCV
jgi:hypothetical protein